MISRIESCKHKKREGKNMSIMKWISGRLKSPG